MIPRFVSATLILVFLASPSGVAAQARVSIADDAAEQQFFEALRREDPVGAERYVALRDARGQAVAELQRVQAQYNAAGPELRSVFLRQLKQAQRKYAESSLALLDFLDARDQRLLSNYRDEMNRINGILEERKRARAEFEKRLRDN